MIITSPTRIVTVTEKIVCLCGSTRFAETFNKVAAQLTLEGCIVVRPEVVTYDRESDPQFVDPETKAKLDELHLSKIGMSDEVHVINVGGYIGDSTDREIRHAILNGKVVTFLEQEAGEDYLDRNAGEIGRELVRLSRQRKPWLEPREEAK